MTLTTSAKCAVIRAEKRDYCESMRFRLLAVTVTVFLVGVLLRNRRNFRYLSFKPATNVSTTTNSVTHRGAFIEGGVASVGAFPAFDSMRQSLPMV